MTAENLWHLTEKRYGSCFGSLAVYSNPAEAGTTSSPVVFEVQKSKHAVAPQTVNQEQSPGPRTRQSRPSPTRWENGRWRVLWTKRKIGWQRGDETAASCTQYGVKSRKVSLGFVGICVALRFCQIVHIFKSPTLKELYFGGQSKFSTPCSRVGLGKRGQTTVSVTYRLDEMAGMHFTVRFMYLWIT